MEVARIDAYMARWSSDAEIAVASESAGLQFLSPDAAIMKSDESLKLNRSKPPTEMPKGRIIDMQWSPTFTNSTGGCFLAVILDTGTLVILENQPSEARLVEAITDYNFCAVTWLDRQIVAGDSLGNIHLIEGGKVQSTAPVSQSHSLPILYLTSSTVTPDFPEIGAILSDNSGWVKRGIQEWEQVTPANRFSVVSVSLREHQLVTLRCGQVYVNDKSFSSNSLLPGFLLTSSLSTECLVIHSNGTRTNISNNSGSVTLPQIQGDVIHAELHPYLPMGIVILNKGSAAKLDETANQWKFPILSSQNIAVYFFPIAGAVTSPQRSQYNFVAYWLSCLVNSSQLTDIMAWDRPLSDIMPNLAQIEQTGTLLDQLSELFTSSFADQLRLKWFLAKTPADQDQVVSSMRSAIAHLLGRFPAKSPIDKLVLLLYKALAGGDENTEFTITGDFISDTFNISDSKADQRVIKSTGGRIWKRCALTLLPILVFGCRQSADEVFAVYNSAPTSLSGKPSTENPITEALLSAGRFCVFSGTSWIS